MNYLAHLFLSSHNHDLMVGNFIGDAVKGNDHENYSAGVQKGIIMHRAIDDFTDHHELVIDSKKYFVKEFDKYSGVLIDIYFDYFLATKFANYSATPLNNFAGNTYTILNNNRHLFPQKTNYFFDYMIRENILFRYAELDGIKQVLHGMTNRIKQRYPLYESIDEFKNNQNALYNNFSSFFEELKIDLSNKGFINSEK